MTDQQPDPRSLWRDQETEGDLMPVEQIRSLARTFQTRGRFKRIAGILATALSAGLAARTWSDGSNEIVRTGAVLLPIAIGLLTIHTFYRTAPAPADQTATECLTYVTASARRELQIVRGDWLLIAAPVFMAMGVMVAGLMIENGSSWARMAPIALAFVAWAVGMVVVLRRKSRSLARDLAELEALSR